MTELIKPGSNSKVASIPCVFQLETRTVSHQSFTDFLKYFRYPQKLEFFPLLCSRPRIGLRFYPMVSPCRWVGCIMHVLFQEIQEVQQHALEVIIKPYTTHLPVPNIPQTLTLDLAMSTLS